MWTIEPSHSGTKFCVKSEERDEHGPYTEIIAMVHAPDNALLIAAAPDMMEALEELIGEWETDHADENHQTGYTMPSGGLLMARAALAKARGE